MVTNKLYYTYTEHSTGGEVLSDERWSSRAPTYITWQLKDVFTKEPKHTPYYDEITVKGVDDIKNVEYFYFVIARYSDGDTFGQSEGHCTVVNVLTDGEEAYALAQRVNEGKDTEKDFAPQCYKCWNGYFQSLEECFVEVRRVIF
jgi:hypothetical protein